MSSFTSHRHTLSNAFPQGTPTYSFGLAVVYIWVRLLLEVFVASQQWFSLKE